jgi:hypothetical protein
MFEFASCSCLLLRMLIVLAVWSETWHRKSARPIYSWSLTPEPLTPSYGDLHWTYAFSIPQTNVFDWKIASARPTFSSVVVCTANKQRLPPLIWSGLESERTAKDEESLEHFLRNGFRKSCFAGQSSLVNAIVLTWTGRFCLPTNRQLTDQYKICHFL